MPKTASRAKKKLPKCCQKTGEEVFTYWKSNFVFDIEMAKAMVQDGRKPVRVARASVRTSVDRCWIRPRHLPHVDPSRPGIIAEIRVKTVEGEVIHAHLLIDGNHRAARCLQLKRTFYAYLLTAAESKKILIEEPRIKFHSRKPKMQKPRRKVAQ